MRESQSKQNNKFSAPKWTKKNTKQVSKKAMFSIGFVCFSLLFLFINLYQTNLNEEKIRQQLAIETQLNRVQHQLEIALEKEYSHLYWFINQLNINKKTIFTRLPTLANIVLETSPHIEAIFWQEKSGKSLWSQLNPNIPDAQLKIKPGTNQLEDVFFSEKPQIQSTDVIISEQGKASLLYYFPVTMINESGTLGIKIDLISVLNKLKDKYLASTFGFSLYSNNMLFYRSSMTFLDTTLAKKTIQHFNQDMYIRLHPVQSMQNTFFSSSLFILFVGFFITALVGSILYLLEKNSTGRRKKSQFINDLISQINKKQDNEALLYFSANYDRQTRLANSNALYQYLIRCIESQQKIIVISISLDNFNDIIDLYGQDIANPLLLKISKRFKQVTSSQGILARTGQEQFTFACENMSASNADLFANRFYLCLDKSFSFSGHEIQLLCSIGVTYRYQTELTAEQLLHQAEIAKNQAKKSSHNNIIVYDQAFDAARKQKKQLASQLKKAIDEDALSLIFQIQLDKKTNKINCIEVLTQWVDEKNRLIESHKLLKIAKQTGLQIPLRHWQITNSLKHYAALLDDRGAPPYLAIKLSNTDFSEGQTGDFLLQKFKQFDIPAARILLEISAKTLTNQLASDPAMINKLTNKGVKLIISQLDTESFSFSAFKNKSIYAIKIDSRFLTENAIPSKIEQENKTAQKSLIGQAVFSMAHLFSIKIIASGIDTKKAEKKAKAFKVDLVQGNVYFPPLQLATLKKTLRDAKSVNSAST